MPKFDPTAIPAACGSDYPPPYDAPVASRQYRRMAPVFGFGALGASYVTLEPGVWSSQRHWHDEEDELVVMVAGTAVLIEGREGEAPTRTLLGPGDVCGWAGGDGIAHHLVNESDTACTFVAVSAGNAQGSGGYADIDMLFAADGYFHKDGRPYPAEA